MQTHANMFTLLVAPPGVGKQVILEVQELWRDVREQGGTAPSLRVAPQRMSQASLVDTIAKAKNAKLTPSGPVEDYASLLIASEELQYLIPKWDSEFLGKLTFLYQNPPVLEEELRYGKHASLKIVRPQLNILGGTQPGMMQETFPDTAWQGGLMSRFVLVFSSQEIEANPFEVPKRDPLLREELLVQLSHLAHLHGEMALEKPAEALIWNLWTGQDGSRPTHSKLEHYTRRRGQTMIKLALISAIARGARPPDPVTLQDAERARQWLLDAEAVMPDIFRAMTGKSDRQVLEELYLWMVTRFKMQREKPVPQQELLHFLVQRVPGDKAQKLLEVAEASGFVERFAGTLTYRPRARDGIGVE
jgi:hypothetical protein